MQNKFYIIFIVIFIIGCSNKAFDTDKELLNHTLTNSPSDPKYSVKNITLYNAPSEFKKIKIDFDFYLVNFISKENNEVSQMQHFVVNNGEIYRLGKGLDCLIIAQEFRWNEKGKLIYNFNDWYSKNSTDIKLQTSKPKTKNNIFQNKQRTNSLTDKFNKFICK